MPVPSVRRTVALVCVFAGLALLVPAAPAAGRGSPNTASLQVALKALHHYKGRIDGIPGPATKRATRRFQRAHGLRVDGVAGPATRRKLGKRGRPSLASRAARRGQRGWDVAGIQWLLRRRGFKPYGTDGGFGANTDAAVRRAQTRYGIIVDGLAGPQTINALKRNRGPRQSSQTKGPSGPVRFLRPVRAQVTSGFGYRWGRLHAGVDFGAPWGTRVGAGGVGTVISAGWNSGGFGYLVVIQHRLGFTSWYGHLSRVAVRVGQRVAGGTTIGYVGSTGRSTGPHLHFEVRHNGSPVNPGPYLLNAYSRLRVTAARTDPMTGGIDPDDGCVPGGLIETDPERAVLVGCRDGRRSGGVAAEPPGGAEDEPPAGD